MDGVDVNDEELNETLFVWAIAENTFLLLLKLVALVILEPIMA